MLLVTRPREQALEWVQRLRESGVPAQAMPLLGILPAPEPAALTTVRRSVDAGHYSAVMFVSPNAVAGFFGSGAPSSAVHSSAASASPTTWPANTWAAAPGPGTAAVLRQHGVPQSSIVQPPADAPQFDSESLWPQLEPLSWSGRRVLVVRGEGGRDWLIDRWTQAGAVVDTVAAYRAGPPEPTAAEWQHLQQAVQEPASHVWLLSSSQSLGHWPRLLERLGPGPASADWPTFAGRALCLATHPRILAAAQDLGLQRVQACRSDWQGVVASYNQLHRES